MIDFWLHPAFILIVGALLLPIMKNPVVRRPFLVLVPVLTFAQILAVNAKPGVYGVVSYLNWNLTFGRVDNLSTIFAFIMGLMCIIGTVYGMHDKNQFQHMASWFYAAGSLGVIYCADYLVLFLFWEMMSFGSVFLIWCAKGPKALKAGYRYLFVHTAGGLFLLAGFVLRYQATGGDLFFGPLDVANPQLYTYLIAIGLIVNAAVPPFHSWLPDAYAEATFNGSVFLCAFTTKTAIYACIRALSGMDLLIPLGLVMILGAIIYGIMENDSRRVLAWDIISQVGYMVVGIGIGTPLAINGAAAHAVVHILYKSLLFMGVGSVMYMTGKTKLTELGGLYKKMPVTMFLTLIGGLSVSAFPLFCAFVSKAMIITAAMNEHMMWTGYLLLVGSAGPFVYVCLKLVYYIFFGEECDADTMDKAAEPPVNMKIAMMFGAFMCVLVGTYVPFLYNMLPFQFVEYHPYGAYHIAETLQILAFAGFGFFVFRKYLKPTDTISIDLDWIYRMFGRGFYWFDKMVVERVDTWVSRIWDFVLITILMQVSKFWSWFDWHAIDGVVDGLARSVRSLGGQVRRLQSGQIQYNIYFAATVMAIAIFAYAFAS